MATFSLPVSISYPQSLCCQVSLSFEPMAEQCFNSFLPLFNSAPVLVTSTGVGCLGLRKLAAECELAAANRITILEQELLDYKRAVAVGNARIRLGQRHITWAWYFAIMVYCWDPIPQNNIPFLVHCLSQESELGRILLVCVCWGVPGRHGHELFRSRCSGALM